MKYLVAGIILVASLAFGAFTPPSGSPVYDPTQTEENTANITTNAMNITTNTSDISDNTGYIATNASDISDNAGSIAENTLDISTNTAARVAMGNWAWVQDGTNLIAVYTAP